VEAKADREVIFGILPALCGARKPTDYRMMPPDDEIHRRATRVFFVNRASNATCLTCRKLSGLS
jgi:hypothetical protein